MDQRVNRRPSFGGIRAPEQGQEGPRGPRISEPAQRLNRRLSVGGTDPLEHRQDGPGGPCVSESAQHVHGITSHDRVFAEHHQQRLNRDRTERHQFFPSLRCNEVQRSLSVVSRLPAEPIERHRGRLPDVGITIPQRNHEWLHRPDSTDLA